MLVPERQSTSKFITMLSRRHCGHSFLQLFLNLG